ncbi:MAG: glycosyltransferase [Saprospiraceae bacterium]|nr:glycosyltransferase [Saprospiraceae bacterium]
MERAGVNLANSLCKSNQEVTFISFFKQEHFFKLNNGIQLIEPKGFNTNSLSILKSIYWIRKQIQELKPDSIIVFNKLYGAITCLSLVGTGYKIYLSERSSPIYQWPKIQNLIINLIFTFIKPYGVISQTNIAKEYQKKYFGNRVKIEVVPNALREIDVFPETEKKNIILAVGRFNDPLKGFDMLLEAFSMVQNHDWKLHFAGGEKNEDPILEKIIREKNLEDRIQFLGKVKEMDLIYASASIFVIPSRSEGFPNVLIEAMAFGLPCISFDFIAGPKDIITHEEDGILVENGNIESLANRINRLIENDKERLRLANNAKKIRYKYSSEMISNKLLTFLENE